MTKRTEISGAVGDLLDARNARCVEKRLEAVGSNYPRLDNDSSPGREVEIEYKIGRAKRQVLFAALTELACRDIIPRMVSHLEVNNNLLIPGTDKAFDQDTYSPSARQFLDSMHGWFGVAMTRIIDEAKEGKQPQAAILEGGVTGYAQFHEADQLWVGKSSSAFAEMRRGQPPLKSNLNEAIMRALVENASLMGGLLVGRGIAAEREGVADKMTYMRHQLGSTALLSSASLVASIPVFKPALLKVYSRWECGEISPQEFVEITRNSLIARELPFHKSLANGRWPNPGFCSADVMFVKPDKFTVSPNELLRMLDVEPEEEANFAAINLAAATSMAEGTIYKVWPE